MSAFKNRQDIRQLGRRETGIYEALRHAEGRLGTKRLVSNDDRLL
jgi:hypothetical protein